MKSRILTCFTAIALLAALSVSVQTAAQNNHHNHRPTHHHYQLIDVGTFGGPSAFICNDPTNDGGPCPVLNNRGTVVGAAETSIPDPNYPNSCLFCDPFISHAFRWQDGKLADLGALPGLNSSFANSISPKGLVAGFSENGAIDPLLGVAEIGAVLWNDGEIVNLGTIEGGYESQANAVNDGGQVAGAFLNTIPDPFSFFGTQLRAFLWRNGVMEDLGTLGTGTDADAYFINERGQVAGTSNTNTVVNPVTGMATQDPFLWENGKMTDLGTLGGTFGEPNAINNRGQVVGQSNLAGDLTAHPFLWDRGSIKDLGTLGGCCAVANWINNAGAVVGGSWTSNDQNFQAFLWKDGRMTNLGPSGVCSGALGINSEEQVVGFTCGNGVAMLWDSGQAIDLNIFNHSGSGFQYLALAFNINDRGEIDGLGVPPGCDDPFACGHVFVLIPCDEGHPGIKGCDYSMVDASVATSAGSRPFVQNPTTAKPWITGAADPMMHFFRHRSMPWHRNLGVQTQPK
jgi:probable HAF family extracellular repeat protein